MEKSVLPIAFLHLAANAISREPRWMYPWCKSSGKPRLQITVLQVTID